MKIKFCGAATGVTGSCHLIEGEGHRILLDCGQFQGGRAQEKLNAEPFPFDIDQIEDVVLSHAHIDHCGRLPLLVKRGFTGRIFCTDATADLLGVMLRDSAHIHQMEAEWQNRKNERAGRSLVEPLYTMEDAELALKQVVPILYDQLVDINDKMQIVFNDAGHILGSAITEIWVKERDKTSKIVFTGDLGVKDRPILRDPTIIKKADYVIMESTYGNRTHPLRDARIDKLVDIIIGTAKKGGSVVIPAFAVGRTQELIYEIKRYIKEGGKWGKRLLEIPFYVDSPMATSATEIFKRNAQAFDKEARDYILNGDNPLTIENLRFTLSSKESQAINFNKDPKVIISASGMCEAGRIRHHLKHNAWDPKASIVFVGYQAQGTLGRNLLDGVKDIKLFGEKIHVNAKIYNLEGFSGHADMLGLLDWVGGFQKKPKKIFLVHGENESKDYLKGEIEKRYGYDVEAIHEVSEYELVGDSIEGTPSAVHEKTDEEGIEVMRERLNKIHNSIEDILYNTDLMIAKNAEPEHVAEINNVVLELEKKALKLGSIVTDKKVAQQMPDQQEQNNVV